MKMITLDFFDAQGSEFLDQYSIGLKLEEAQNLQKEVGRPLTLCEAIIFGIQLSEHCSYKSSRSFLKNLPTKGDNVVLGPAEDAGVLKVFDYKGENYCIAVAQESHNHPSQVVPFEGAATGVGGICRDIMCMGAKVIGVLDHLRLGDLKKLESRNIALGVVEGIAGYANPLGVPNLGGDVFFDASFDHNCLVNVTALGVLRESDLIHSFVDEQAKEEDWDLIIVGKPTDNSGFGGASFGSGSFSELDDKDSQKAAIQEPNPFLERHLFVAIEDLLSELKEEGLYHQIAMKDLGAGGVVCATVEIVDGAGLGAEIYLEKLHKTKAYDPEVLACSETQERFCFAVHPSLTNRILDHFNQTWELGKIAANAGASHIGKTRTDGQYKVYSHKDLVCDLPAKIVTQGILYNREYEVTENKNKPLNIRFSEGLLVME